MPFALISDNVAVQIADEQFPVHPSLVWIDAGAASVGWIYADGALTAPPAPPALVVAVPQSVSMYQAQFVLYNTPSATAGKSLLDLANAAIESAGPLAALAWSKAAQINRDSPMMAQVASALGMTDKQIDDLFVAAAAVSA
jgi:hypothetical protein